MSTQDERLERIRRKIANSSNWNPSEPLPRVAANIHGTSANIHGTRSIPTTRSESLTDRIEYVLNMREVERMDLEEKGTRLPKVWSWAVIQYMGAAVKPATLSPCERVKLRIQRRLRLIGEWFFRIAQ